MHGAIAHAGQIEIASYLRRGVFLSLILGLGLLNTLLKAFYIANYCKCSLCDL